MTDPPLPPPPYVQHLEALGLSRRRTAIPAAEGTMEAAFTTNPLSSSHMATLLLLSTHPLHTSIGGGVSGGGVSGGGGVSEVEYAQVQQHKQLVSGKLLRMAREAWSKADGYYFRNMALQQRLQEVCLCVCVCLVCVYDGV